MSAGRDPRSVLLGLTGLEIDGGIASVSRCVARALDECSLDGTLEQVDRVLLLDDPARTVPPPARGRQWLARGSQPRFLWQLWRAYRRQRHDLVFFDHVGVARSVRVPLPGFPPDAYAIFVHGIELDAALSGGRTQALAGARVLVTNSEFTARALARLFPALEQRVRVALLCIDPERVATWERGPHASVPREPVVLIVARMSAEERGKGHEELIAAWPAVRARVPKAELWIVGGGDDRPRFEARAQGLGVADSVRFLGRVSDPDLGALYARASVFAMPSRQEGFGLVYAEAMWHGLACLGSTADAAGEVIVDGETGLLVPYGDAGAIVEALTSLLGDPARTARMGEAGRCRSRERFAYPRFRRDLLAALFGA